MKICNVETKTKFTLKRNNQIYYLVAFEMLEAIVRTQTGQIIKLDKSLEIIVDNNK